MPIEFTTIRIHAYTVSQLRKLCAFKQMQTGEKWSLAKLIDELLAEYPAQDAHLPSDMFTLARGKKK